MTILLVEDDEALLDYAKEILEAQGYKVLTATAGLDAVRVFEEHEGKIELVLTDVIMPRMGGPALYLHLRSLKAEQKFLFMSGFSDAALIEHGINPSDVVFVQKPFSPKSLVEKVREVIGPS
jgi:two-component system, cell cycle sensor histidine kinase and response regulator CckA